MCKPLQGAPGMFPFARTTTPTGTTPDAPIGPTTIPGDNAQVRRVSRRNRMSIRSDGTGLSVPL